MSSLRPFRALLALLLAAVALSAPAASAAPTASAPPAAPRDFDFLIGDWRVHHRRIMADTKEWAEFAGTMTHYNVMDGAANVDENVLHSPRGVYHAASLRAWDAKARQWAIWWLDGRYPSGPLGAPVKGRFENGVGTFFADYEQDGRAMRVRFLWSDITPTSARWQQASSADAGRTWQTNWIMTFTRADPDGAQSRNEAGRTTDGGQTAGGVRPAALDDFAFLIGDWRVHHRYLRSVGDKTEWAQAHGTVSHRNILDGWANRDDNVLNPESGTYRALALRSYDARGGQWAIWWLDGRDPSAVMDPPMKGAFERGVGTFFGEITFDGKPTPVRFIWSKITPRSAQWEQAYSHDGGRTWETNWIMEFSRAS